MSPTSGYAPITLWLQWGSFRPLKTALWLEKVESLKLTIKITTLTSHANSNELPR
jgi:hypothetical protein